MLAVLLVRLCGCADDGADGLRSLPPCAISFAEGVPVDAARAASESGCVEENGDLSYFGMGVDDCEDGRQLLHNDEGWAFSDGVWSRHDRAAGPLLPPAAAREECDP